MHRRREARSRRRRPSIRDDRCTRQSARVVTPGIFVPPALAAVVAGERKQDWRRSTDASTVLSDSRRNVHRVVSDGRFRAYSPRFVGENDPSDSSVRCPYRHRVFRPFAGRREPTRGGHRRRRGRRRRRAFRRVRSSWFATGPTPDAVSNAVSARSFDPAKTSPSATAGVPDPPFGSFAGH